MRLHDLLEVRLPATDKPFAATRGLTEIQHTEPVEPETIRVGINDARANVTAVFAKLGDVTVWHGTDRHTAWFLFVRDRHAVGYAYMPGVTVAGIAGHFMTEIALRPTARGQGVGLAFYRLLLARGWTLFSGAQHTRDGEQVWRKLMAMPDVTIRAIRRGADDDVVLDDLAGIDPWSDPDLFLVARRA